MAVPVDRTLLNQADPRGLFRREALFDHGLVDLGLKPHLLSETLLSSLYDIADQWKHRADVLAMRPTVQWRDARQAPR